MWNYERNLNVWQDSEYIYENFNYVKQYFANFLADFKMYQCLSLFFLIIVICYRSISNNHLLGFFIFLIVIALIVLIYFLWKWGLLNTFIISLGIIILIVVVTIKLFVQANPQWLI